MEPIKRENIVHGNICAGAVSIKIMINFIATEDAELPYANVGIASKIFSLTWAADLQA
jgi:hypothetical protein